MKRLDVANKRFGRLVVGSEAPPLRGYRRRLSCQCDCGEVVCVLLTSLMKRQTTSCGCWKKEQGHIRGKTNLVHGHSRAHEGRNPTRTYRTWQSMHTRCSNAKSDNFKRYGGRGITVCERWSVFENFLADMGERPQSMTLDRINNDGNYEPSNCRWADASTQRKNQRTTQEPITQ